MVWSRAKESWLFVLNFISPPFYWDYTTEKRGGKQKVGGDLKILASVVSLFARDYEC
ncbi:MAG: hypothetical protein QMD71_09545 [bacterium]|nr:hypothetical protein [bacterium]